VASFLVKTLVLVWLDSCLWITTCLYRGGVSIIYYFERRVVRQLADSL